jgi:hypothetical protein
MKKQVIELKKGDVFLDTNGLPFRVERIEEIPWLGISRTKPMVKLWFWTGRNVMFGKFRADRIVEIKPAKDC